MVLNSSFSLVWTQSDGFIAYVIDTFFEQPQLDSTALIRGRWPDGETRTWLYYGREHNPISQAQYDKFRKAAKTRGGVYTMEICEFVVEEMLPDGGALLNYWRRVRDDTGEGGRVIVTQQGDCWIVTTQLGGWENRP
ncbi:MAG TPA: hypothetical protein VKQ72_17980 [Aggregatilineales bacterium]|nr:hypothetical protein [Aggregatilineales bacterium]